jgi:hypothetical protein
MDNEPIGPVKHEVAIQADVKKPISQKRLDALKKGREEYHRQAREYKKLMLEKNVVVVEQPAETVVEPPVVKPVAERFSAQHFGKAETVAEPPPVKRQFAFV